MQINIGMQNANEGCDVLADCCARRRAAGGWANAWLWTEIPARKPPTKGPNDDQMSITY